MKSKLAALLVTGGLLTSAAWFMRSDSSATQPVFKKESEGVPEKYRATVEKGLEYLARNQCADGHWEGDGGKNPVATTALVGIAFLMDGGAVSNAKYADNLRKAADWLMSQARADRDGLIYSGHASETERYMEGHGLATQFLAWHADRKEHSASREKKYAVIGKAVDYIVKAQSTQGGWHRTSRAEGHDFAEIPSTAIQFQALLMVESAGIVVGGSTKTDVQAYLKAEIEKQKEKGKPELNPRRAAHVAAAVVCRADPYAYLEQDGVSTEWLTRCRQTIPMGADVKFGRDELTHYHYAQALFNRMLNDSQNADTAWSGYRTTMFDHLQGSQAKDGSWSGPADSESVSVGPIYSTAVWCAVMQFDKRRHPLTRARVMYTF